MLGPDGRELGQRGQGWLLHCMCPSASGHHFWTETTFLPLSLSLAQAPFCPLILSPSLCEHLAPRNTMPSSVLLPCLWTPAAHTVLGVDEGQGQQLPQRGKGSVPGEKGLLRAEGPGPHVAVLS